MPVAEQSARPPATLTATGVSGDLTAVPPQAWTTLARASTTRKRLISLSYTSQAAVAGSKHSSDALTQLGRSWREMVAAAG